VHESEGKSDDHACWEHFAHGADIGVRGRGPTPAAAFEQAALAVTAVVADLARVRPRVRVELECRAADLELLLFDWLSAIIEEMDLRKMLFSRFNVEIADGRLVGFAEGEAIDRERHDLVVEIKGATMTELRVGPDPDSGSGWLAQCVVDV
jgi:tRNA nucleotidyltransferase (CCA-adding enzyme)